MTVQRASRRVTKLRSTLSERDLAVLRSLHKLRLLNGKQIERLHVYDGSAATRARRTRAILKRLVDLGLVVRFDRSIGGVRAGSSGHVHGLSGQGQAVLEVAGPYGRRRRVWETKPYFQDHVLAVAELYIALVERSRDGDCDLLAFEGEPACWRHLHGHGGGGLVTLKPDAYICLGIDDVERSAFIEMDMASEALPTVQSKCQRYIDYWRSGQEQKAHGVFPVVLWLVPNERRRDRVVEVIHRLAVEARTLFAVAIQPDGASLLAAAAGDSA